MFTDEFGQQIYSENDLCRVIMRDPSIRMKHVLIDKDITIPDDLVSSDKVPKLILYNRPTVSLSTFDAQNQSLWYMPDEYKTLDIAKFVLDQCTDEVELQRAGKELLMFQERDLTMMLRYLKYLVDVMRKNNIVWGVGRGSSVASFVLFLIGVHKINPIYYDLDISDFLK